MHWHYIHYFTRILLFSITTCERVLLLLLKKQNVSTKLDEKILTTGICVVWGRLRTMALLLWGFNLKCRSILKTASTLLDSPASLDFEVFDLAVDLICFNYFTSNLTHFLFQTKQHLICYSPFCQHSTLWWSHHHWIWMKRYQNQCWQIGKQLIYEVLWNGEDWLKSAPLLVISSNQVNIQCISHRSTGANWGLSNVNCTKLHLLSCSIQLLVISGQHGNRPLLVFNCQMHLFSAHFFPLIHC